MTNTVSAVAASVVGTVVCGASTTTTAASSSPVSPSSFEMSAVAATALSGISSSPRISEIVNVLDLGWFFLGERLVMGLLH